MHRPASIGRLFALAMILAVMGILFSSRRAMTDAVVEVTSLGGLTGANDQLSWSQLGGDGSSLNATFDANTGGSVSVVGTLTASGSLTSVVCPAAQCSWGSPGNGGFAEGDTLIWTSDTGNGGTGPLTLAFGTTVMGVGAMIQADGPAQFTAQVQAFNGATLLGTFTATSDASGDAVFLGVLDNSAANISSVVYSLTSCIGACTDFAIDTVFLNTTGGGPTPAATPVPTPVTTISGPAQVKFGNVKVGNTSSAKKVSISNKGTNSAVVGTVTLPTEFVIKSGTDLCSNQTVAPKKSCSMMLQFSPSTAGPASGSVMVPYNGAPVSIAVSGTGK